MRLVLPTTGQRRAPPFRRGISGRELRTLSAPKGRAADSSFSPVASFRRPRTCGPPRRSRVAAGSASRPPTRGDPSTCSDGCRRDCARGWTRVEPVNDIPLRFEPADESVYGCTVSSHDRSRMSFKVRYAVKHPGRVWPYARRSARDRLIALRAGGHVEYYRGIMESDTARGGDRAVGNVSRSAWLAAGQRQFDYLLRHGLTPETRMLEIG